MSRRPELEYIPVSKLTVDPEVQRNNLDERRVQDMAANFQLDLVGVLEVSRRTDGTLHVLDGMHRSAAAKATGHGDLELPSLVHTGLSREREAQMFLGLNNAKSVGAVDKFRVRVIAGNTAAREINQVLVEYGWTVKAGASDGYFMAVAAIEGVYNSPPTFNRTRQEIVNKTIAVLTEAWGRHPDGVRSQIVTGVGSMLLRYGSSLDTVKLVNSLKGYSGGPRRLVADGQALRQYRRGRVGDAIAEILVRDVNKGRKVANRLPDWRDSDVEDAA